MRENGNRESAWFAPPDNAMIFDLPEDDFGEHNDAGEVVGGTEESVTMGTKRRKRGGAEGALVERESSKKKRALEKVLALTTKLDFPWYVRSGNTAIFYENKNKKNKKKNKPKKKVEKDKIREKAASGSDLLPLVLKQHSTSSWSDELAAKSFVLPRSASMEPKKALTLGGKARVERGFGGDSSTGWQRPDSVLPPSFGSETEYECFDCFVKKGEQGLGVKLKNIDEKAVVRGFTPWRILASKAASSLRSRDDATSAAVPLLGGVRSASTAKASKGAGNDIHCDEALMSTLSPSANAASNSAVIAKSTEPVREVYIGKAAVRVNDVVLAVNNLDARSESFAAVVEKLKASSDLLCVRFARPLLTLEALTKANTEARHKEEAEAAAIAQAAAGVSQATAKSEAFKGNRFSDRGRSVAKI